MANENQLPFPTKAIPENSYDIDHIFGNDLTLSSTGDLQTVSGSVKGEQRVLRRLLTNPLDDIWNPTYGAGLAEFVGEALSSELFTKIKSRISSNIFQESCVSKNPAPEILLQTIQNGLYCQINYNDKASQTPIIITFDVSP